MTDVVTIDDLGSPRFTPDIDAVRAAMAEMADGLKLEPAALMAAAAAETGLSGFGDTSFVERLDVLCGALRREAGLSPSGVTAQFAMLIGLLKNRLRIEHQIARHPEILDVPIEAPIVICGLPRTGTTHLHNLMSADPSLRSLPYWESLEPVLAEEERGTEPDPRLSRTEQQVSMINAAMPHFRRMHEMTVDHVHEEIQLLAIDFSTMLFETLAPMPSWRDHYLSHDQRPSYAYLKRILQVLQWQRGGSRWVLKSPQHLEQFPALLATFPDATFVVTHRDPVSVTASLATLVTYGARMACEEIDLAAFGAYWSDRVERMLRQCVADRDVLPAARSIDVRFDEFMADDVGMVERIYGLAGQPMTADVRQAMQAFMASHPRGRFGSVRYDLTRFGVDPGERRQALQFYVDRFGVAIERP